jgi:hypothetical protein
MNTSRRVRREKRALGEQRRPDDHPDGVGGDEVARSGDGDPEIGGHLGEQARHRELRQADGERSESHGEEREPHQPTVSRAIESIRWNVVHLASGVPYGAAFPPM